MVDITVRGAGIFGLSIAWACVERGASVRIVDPHGAGSGASGGILGALAPHVPENWNAKKAFQLESLLMADGFWQAVEEAGGALSGYARTGRLQPIAGDQALSLARARSVTAASLWQDEAQWSVVPTPGDGWAPASPSGLLIHDSLSAHLHPRKACMALVAALAARGVGIDPDGADTGKVLWATGTAGLQALSAEHGRAVGTGIKGQAALLAHDAVGLPQLFVDGVHVIPHLDGTVAVGATTERVFDAPQTTDAALDTVIGIARAHVPALRDAPVIDRWAALRPRSRSRAPLLGDWPGRPGHYIANGGFKIGFGMAPKVAEVMADLLLEGRSAIPAGFGVVDNL